MFRAGSIHVTTREEIRTPSRIQTQFCQSVYDNLAPYMYSTTDGNESSSDNPGVQSAWLYRQDEVGEWVGFHGFKDLASW